LNSSIVDASTVNAIKARLDKFWSHQFLILRRSKKNVSNTRLHDKIYEEIANTYLANPVVVPRVSVIDSLHVVHFAFHLFSLLSTMNSLNANFTTSGGFTDLEDKLVSVLLSDAIV